MEREELLSRLATALLRALFATLRIRFHDLSGLTRESPPFPLIFTFWHNRILAITSAFLRHYPASRRGVSVLTSPSRDGEILARVVRAFGMGSVRGSSSRRGSLALRECLAILENGADLAITPDGPRGPRYSLGPGLLLLCQQTGARIAPVHVRFGACVRLKTWDGFCIPLPFSRLEITLGPYESIPPTETEEAFEAERLRIESYLKNAAD